MDNISESKKIGVVIFGQQFRDIPIKKRISLRDSALYHPTPSSAVMSDKEVGSPSLVQHSNPAFSSKQQPDNVKAGQLDDNSSEIVVLNTEKADSPPDFSGIKTHIDSTLSNKINSVDDTNKNRSTEAISPCTESKLPLVSSSVSVTKDDGLGTKSSEHDKLLTSGITGDSCSDDKSTIQPHHPCKDHESVQSTTQVRILWDLNVEMDAWEEQTDHQSFESQLDVTTSECMLNAKLDVSEDMLTAEPITSEINTATDKQSTYTSANSAGICKHEHLIPGSTDNLVSGSVREDLQVAGSNCPDRTFSDTEQILKIDTMNMSCKQKLTRGDEQLTSILGENASKLSDDAPNGDPESSLETTKTCSESSSEKQNCDDKNIVTRGESSGNILQVCSGHDGSSTKMTNTKAGQLEVIGKSSSDHCTGLFEQRTYVEEEIPLVTLSEEIINETPAASVHHMSEEMTKNSPDHADVSMENQIPDSFQEGCDAAVLKPICPHGKCDQVAVVSKQVLNTDTDLGGQTEQDYEDGELRDLDMHCWNGFENEIEETECLDYETVAGNIDKLDDSSTSVSVVGKDEGELQNKKNRSVETLIKDQLVSKDGTNPEEKVISRLCSESYLGTHTSNTQLERKLSGWDQLPKDDHKSLEKIQETQRISSRTSRSELQGFVDIPTLSEDAEEKETVLERRFRLKDMDDSYPVESGTDFDKFNGKRRSTFHMHGRNRVEDWDSEHRSSVNYHDLYDNHSGSRPLIMNSKGHERFRSRSPSVRSETYDAHASYSRYYRGRYGRHAEGSGRSFRGARNGYRGSLADDRDDPELCVRQQFIRRDRSFSPRASPHFSGPYNRSRSRSRTRSPPLWLPPYERMGPRGHRRSPDFGAEDRVKRTRFPFWKSSFTSDNEMRHTSPSRGGFSPHNRSRWNDSDDFDMGDPRDRSPVRSPHHKVKFNATCSRGRFKSSEDFRPMGYQARTRQIASPARVMGYIGGSDRRKCEDGFEAGHHKRFYKDGFTQKYQHEAEDDTATQNCPLKEDFSVDGESRIGNMRKKDSTLERYEYDQLNYAGSTPNAKR